MSIIILDSDPKKAAQYLPDRYLTTLIKPVVNSLLTANKKPSNCIDRLIYEARSRDVLTKWALSSKENYRWLYQYFAEMAIEYSKRYNKRHPNYVLLTDLLSKPSETIPDEPLQPFPQILPACYKEDDPISAYRRYFCEKETYIATWREPATIPEWLLNKHNDGVSNDRVSQ